MKKFLVFLWAMVLVFGIGSAWAVSVLPVEIPIDPQATYLHTYEYDIHLDAKVILLSDYGITEGDWICLERIGGYRMFPEDADQAHTMGGVFSSSDVLLGSELLDRVPGAIDAGYDIKTGNTWDPYPEGEPTDIPQDFEITGTGTIIQVPLGAEYLFVAALDAAYRDNDDPNGDYGVRISLMPEPAIIDIDPDIFVVQVKENQEPKEPKWAFLRGFVELPEGLSVEDIDVDTVTLSVNDTALAMAEFDKVVDNVLFVLFPLDLTNVSDILGLEATRVIVIGRWIKVTVTTDPDQPIDLIKLTISGNLVDDGGSFTGDDVVRMKVRMKLK